MIKKHIARLLSLALIFYSSIINAQDDHYGRESDGEGSWISKSDRNLEWILFIGAIVYLVVKARQKDKPKDE